jgi:hypothetical protein
MPLTLKQAMAKLEGEPDVLRQDGWRSLSALLDLVGVPEDKEKRLFVQGFIPAQYKKFTRYRLAVQKQFVTRSMGQHMVIALEGLPYIAKALEQMPDCFAPQAEVIPLEPPKKPEQQFFYRIGVAPYGWRLAEYPGGVQVPIEIPEEQQALKLIRQMMRDDLPHETIITVLRKKKILYRGGSEWLVSDVTIVLAQEEIFREKFKLPWPDYKGKWNAKVPIKKQ